MARRAPPSANHAAVSTPVAPSTGYSHHRTGISRLNIGVSMMSVGTAIATAVTSPANTPRAYLFVTSVCIERLP
ncbi:hypothetical protein A5762_24940 [Mycolicibacterium elephantis]|nr:hypothetical protein A5762_24940 [Mycolicibacterium elephantis]